MNNIFTFTTFQPVVKTLSLILFFAILNSPFGKTQDIDYRTGEFLVQLVDGADHVILARDLGDFEGRVTSFKKKKRLTPHAEMYSFTFDYGQIHQSRFLEVVKNHPSVLAAQLNKRTRFRAEEPNDPLFADQWHLFNTGQSGGLAGADISILEAWEITTGGTTLNGDTIVIAVIDDGIALDHPELEGMLWKNKFEIEGSGMDDDGNGYIDDIYGWNTFSNSGVVSGNFLGGHGTPVSGMIGAVTNNEEGIAGTNWNIQLMTIVGGDGFESNAIESYSYALTQRKIYDETNGERGAYVVATNSSWGVDRGNPADSPLWCSFYDTLGVHGILSVAATTNRNFNVDEVGDIPTGCNSPYLISVTATTRNDQRGNTGYGANSIELAAPGIQVTSLRRNGGYFSTSGTSYASPLVAGVIGLMYSVPCEGFNQVLRTDPSWAAQMVRESILQGVDQLPHLQNETISGGRLNARSSIDHLLDLCSTTPAPIDVVVSGQDTTVLRIDWTEVTGTERVDLRYRVDSSDWVVLEDVESPFFLDLEFCSFYEIEIRAISPLGEGEWEPVESFKSVGCCETPSEFEITFEDPNTATISWNEILPAFEYVVRFRAYGDEFWQITDLWIPNSITFEDLLACHIYEFQVQARCDTGFTAFSDIMILETPECTNCDRLDHCIPVVENTEFDWIDSIFLGNDTLPVPGRNVPYSAEVSDITSIITMGDTIAIRIKPEVIGEPVLQYFKVWLDLDRNGLFTGNEVIIDPMRATAEALDTFFIIPLHEDIAPGHVRMRVAMQFVENADSLPAFGPCDSISFGQVIDYCLLLHEPFFECPEIIEAEAVVVEGTSILAQWDWIENALAYNIRHRPLNASEWEEDATPNTNYLISGLDPCQPYEVQIRSICPYDTSQYTMSFILFTECPNNVVEISDEDIFDATLYPNPFISEAFLRLRNIGERPSQGSIRIFDLYGRQVGAATPFNLTESAEMNIKLDQLSTYPPGMYLIEIADGHRRKVLRLVKQ